jgi:thiamine biosynthesis lipoprotein
MPWNRSLACGLTWAILALAPAGAGQISVHVVHKKQYAMGTVFDIVAYSESPAQASDAIDQALREIVRLDEVMSDYKPDSALSRLNRSGYDHSQTVPRDLYRVIEESLEYSRLSGGRFDVTVGPLVKLWKGAMRGGHAPSADEEKKLRACVGYQKIELLPPDRIRLHSACLQIDLGSIGKGYALDRAADLLRAHGVSRALLDAGGSSIYALGAPPGESGWLIHLRDPSNHASPQVRLTDNSVSTSEQTPPSLFSGQQAPGHIVDPEKGVPVRSRFAVSAVARTATASDALSTTLLLVGPEQGEGLVRKLTDVAAIWIDPDGKARLVSSGPQIVLSAEPQGVAQGGNTDSRDLH